MKKTLALATAIWTGVASIAAAAQEPALMNSLPALEAADSWVMAAKPRKKMPAAKKVIAKVIDTTSYLTRSDLAYSMKRWIGQIEGTSKESWKEKNGGYYTLYDVPGGHPDRVAFLTLVNGYHLWDGVPAVSQAKFNPGQAVTQAEVLQVIRNLWAYKEMSKFAKGQSVAIAFPAGLGPTDKITRQQFAALATPTLNTFKATVAASLSETNLQLNKDALSAVQDREAALLQERQAAAAASNTNARLAREAQINQDNQSGRDSLIVRDALASRDVWEARAIQDAKDREVLAIKAAADTKAADEAKARLAAAEEKQLAEDRFLRDQSDHFQGGRPLSLSMSGLPLTSLTAPESAYLGPDARVNLALYPGSAFLTGQLEVGMFPGGPGTLMAGGGPQVPVVHIGNVAALQLQPYVGGRANFGWAGTVVNAAVAPAVGLVSRIHTGPVALYAIAEAAFPWEAAIGRLSAVPTTNLSTGVELELNRAVSLIVGWDAQYGQAAFLPYTGSLTTGVNLGF